MTINNDLAWQGINKESRFEIESRFQELLFAIARGKSNCVKSLPNRFDTQCMLVLYSLIESGK